MVEVGARQSPDLILWVCVHLSVELTLSWTQSHCPNRHQISSNLYWTLHTFFMCLGQLIMHTTFNLKILSFFKSSYHDMFDDFYQIIKYFEKIIRRFSISTHEKFSNDQTSCLIILNKSSDILLNHQQCLMGRWLFVNTVFDYQFLWDSFQLMLISVASSLNLFRVSLISGASIPGFLSISFAPGQIDLKSLLFSWCMTSGMDFNIPIWQIPQCICSISCNAPFRTEMCTFLFWMVHCGIWNMHCGICEFECTRLVFITLKVAFTFYIPTQQIWWGAKLDSPCLSLCPSACKWHGFWSMTSVYFGISISNLMCTFLCLSESTLATNFSEILSKIHTFSLKTMHAFDNVCEMAVILSQPWYRWAHARKT